MTRRLFHLLAGLSLLLCVGVAWLYARQAGFGGPELELFSAYVKTLHARYTLRADAGGIGLYGPPFVRGARSAGPSSRAARLTDVLRKTRIMWTLIREDGRADKGGNDYYVNESLVPGWKPLHDEALAEPKLEGVPVLLEALEDPDLFVTAHEMLAYGSDPPDDPADGWGYQVLRRPDASFTYVYAGLRVQLWPLDITGDGVNPGGLITVFAVRAHVDPAQFPRQRARWHRHLDEPVATARYPAAVAGAAALPAAWTVASLLRRARRRRLARRNQCVHCGYDLRATPGACPECGKAAATRR